MAIMFSYLNRKILVVRTGLGCDYVGAADSSSRFQRFALQPQMKLQGLSLAVRRFTSQCY